jgi:hypothetical protein
LSRVEEIGIMAEKINRFCDWPTGRGRTKHECGAEVDDNEPTEFVIDGITYLMDVCTDHHEEWLDLNATALDIATPIASKKASSAVRAVMKGNRGAFTTKDVREWLREQGVDVPESGRLSKEYIEEYKAAH